MLQRPFCQTHSAEGSGEESIFNDSRYMPLYVYLFGIPLSREYHELSEDYPAIVDW